MLSNTAMDRLMQRTQAAIRDLEVTGTDAANQPLADLAAEDTFQRTGEASTNRTNRTATSDPRQKQMVFHLQKGFNLIKKGEYLAAVGHFQNEKALNKMGVSIKETPIWEQAIPATVQDAKRLAWTLSRRNMAYNNNGSLSIDFARLYLPDFNSSEAATQQTIPLLKPKNSSEAAILQHLQHEEALMAAEENIHTYQNLMGGRHVSYVSQPGDEQFNLPELDIASTFEQHRVPVTQDFLLRYPGRPAQIRKTEVWELTEHGGKIKRVRLRARDSQPRPDGSYV